MLMPNWLGYTWSYKNLFFDLQAKAARERLLMKSKQNMKPVLPVTAAALPNEDDIPSSSDNSDAE